MRISTKRQKICFTEKFELKNIMAELRKFTKGFNIRLDQAEDRMSEFKDT